MISLNSLLVFLAFYAFYILLEAFKRKFKVKGEYTRKIAHVITGLGAIFAYNILDQKEFIIVTFAFLLIFIVSYKKRFFNSIHQVERKTYGEITYPLGILLLAFFSYSDPKIFIYGLLILAIPDVVAYVVGKSKGIKSKKTYRGSAAYLISAIIILITGFDVGQAIPIAIVLTAVEFVSPYGLDNLSVPVFYLLSFAF